MASRVGSSCARSVNSPQPRAPTLRLRKSPSASSLRPAWMTHIAEPSISASLIAWLLRDAISAAAKREISFGDEPIERRLDTGDGEVAPIPLPGQHVVEDRVSIGRLALANVLQHDEVRRRPDLTLVRVHRAQESDEPLGFGSALAQDRQAACHALLDAPTRTVCGTAAPALAHDPAPAIRRVRRVV